MASRPLTKLDTAWLHMDRPENRMVINGYFRFTSQLDLSKLGDALREGVAPFERFRQRVVDDTAAFGRPRWVDDDDFDVANHVEQLDVHEAHDEAAVRGVIDGLLSEPLDPARPLWKVYVIKDGAGCLLFFRIHHCIADGIALLQVLLSMCVTQDGASPGAPQSRAGKPWYWWAALPVVGVLWLLHFLWINIWLLVRPADPPTIFRGELGVPKRAARSVPLSLVDVKAVASAAGCKINDVLLATVSGAMRRYAERRGEPLDADCAVRCVVPVNLRPASKAGQLGNYFAIVSPTLPIGQAEPRPRLARIARAMNRLKRNPEAVVVIATLWQLGLFGVAAQRKLVNLLASKTSMVVTNVPGPRTKLSFAGLPIEEIMFWVPMSGALGLGFSIFSYNGQVNIGVLSDAGLVPDPDALAADIGEEFADLQRTFGATTPEATPEAA